MSHCVGATAEGTIRSGETRELSDRPGPDDAIWDDLVRKDPAGHHVQTSAWAHVIEATGGVVWRVSVSDDSGLTAGVQLRRVRFPAIGAAAVGVSGPVFSSPDPGLRRAIVNRLARWMYESGHIGVVLQPSTADESLTRALVDSRFVPAALSPQLGATARLDLEPPMSEILAGMKSKTRYNARLGLRKGVEVRGAGREGPDALARLLRSTADRQNFSRPMGQRELEVVTSAMRGSPEAKIFLASVRGTVVSGALIIGFGDVALYKRGAWSGEHGDAHPNEVMHVHMIEWAKERGYLTYDFDGMDEGVASAILGGEDVKPTGVTRFKLSFGARPVIRPPAYALLRQPLSAANVFARRLPPATARRLESWVRRRL